MKKFLLKSLFLLCALIVGSGSVWATDIVSTLSFSSACAGTGTAKLDDSNASLGNATWTVTSDAAESTFDSDRGVHYGTNKKAVSYIQLSTSSFTAGTISKVEVEACGSNTPSLSVTIGGNAFGTTATNLTNSNVKYTFTGSSDAGAIVVRLAKSSSANGALYVKSVTVTYSTGGTPTCVAPTFSPVAGTYKSAQTVTISTTTEGATIHYTTDGSEPTVTSTTYDSSNKPTVSTNTTIKAIAVKDSYNNSTVASATYNFVTIEHAGTEADPYTVADARNAIDATDGTKTNVYVTGIVCTGGSDFGNNALNYWISDDGTVTNQLEAYRGKNLNNTNFTAETDVKVGEIVTIYGTLTKFNSTYEFTSGNYLVSHKKKPATPTFSPAAGAYTSAQNVTLSCTTDGATIYYTMGDNPATPTSASTPYTGAITVDANATIKAIAIKEGVSSDVATAAYTIDTTPFVIAASTSINVLSAGDLGSIDISYGNITTVVPEVAWYESDGTTPASAPSWIDTDFDASNNLEYLIDENTVNVARTAYLKVYALDDNTQPVYSELITVTQAAADYASLPFTFNGGSSAITSTLGLNQSGLGGDYSSAPKLKFDTTGDYLILNFAQAPGKLSFTLKGNSIGGNYTFSVLESANGTDYTVLEEYNSTNTIGSTAFTETLTPASTTRYIKWIYTTKADGNVALGKISLALPEPAQPSVNDVNHTVTLTITDNMDGWRTFAPVKADQKYTADADVYYVSAAGSSSVTLVKIDDGVPANTPVILHQTSGTTITLTETATDISAPGASNLLAVSTADQNLGKVYRLGYKSAYGVGFYTYTTTSAPEGIVYINSSSSAHEFLGLDFDGETTGVNEVTNTNLTNNTNGFYNLAGQRVAKPTKGLYIVNGRKVIVK